MTTALRLDHKDPEIRKTFIGGSDIAAVMGQSHWTTPLQLWAEKTGKVPPRDLSDVEAVQIGSELEDFIAQQFVKKNPEKKIRRDSRTFVHPFYPYMVYHVDRWIVAEDAMLECKNTSEYKLGDWIGTEIPAEYILQVNWGLGLMIKKIGYFSTLIGGNKHRVKCIEFNEVLFQKQVEAAKNFWENNVLKNVAPSAMEGDEDVLQKLHADQSEKSLQFTGDNALHLDNLIAAKKGGEEQKKLIESELSAIGNQIKQIIGEAEEVRGSLYSATWKKQRVAPFLDTDTMKKDGTYEKYEMFNMSRVLRTKPVKG